MIKLLVFIVLLCYLFNFSDCEALRASQLAEQTLITTLLSGYNKNIRPDDQVSVDIAYSIQQIVSIDEKQQIMTSSSFISQVWYDERLSWTPNASNNINVVMLPVKSLWIPDTMILNSADASGYLTVSDYSLASVDYTGAVYMILPALTVRTRCDFNVKKFPFDKQICNINLTSWSQGSNRITYTENNSVVLVDTSGYNEHPLWKLNGTDIIVTRAEDRAPFENTYNDIISIQLYLERKSLFFIINGILACFVLNFVTLLSYAIPFGSQIGLCMTCFLTYSIYSLNFSSQFPQQSEYLMMITLYFLLSICWTLISMTWFIVCDHFTTKGEQNWNFGGNSDEVWNGWCHVDSKDNFWGCGNNIGLTLQKGDMTCTYRASYYHPSFHLVKLNGKSASGTFDYDRSKSKDEVYNAFTQFIENQIAAQNT
ncbi:unnamed protein product [Rotaria sordida]|uniref:Neurotransmitter-gated ion-channel ligand-binding domain-containing protein n=1 Tax=Rotaria sordida TaxID=392033 RepID=A0A814ZW48_9BILA|nr:unnamed protein product [Rotaria sordida]CAF1248413.1 unnamed protein product [Rotaria sordida]